LNTLILSHKNLSNMAALSSLAEEGCPGCDYTVAHLPRFTTQQMFSVYMSFVWWSLLYVFFINGDQDQFTSNIFKTYVFILAYVVLDMKNLMPKFTGGKVDDLIKEDIKGVPIKSGNVYMY